MPKKHASTRYTETQRQSGDWNPLWSTFERWDPEFLEAYLRLRAVPFTKGSLPKKIKELVLIAINAATTHLYAPGVRRHIRNALQHGATRDEIMEVIELTTLLGIHSSNIAVPILAEELDAQRKTHTSSKVSTKKARAKRGLGKI